MIIFSRISRRDPLEYARGYLYAHQRIFAFNQTDKLWFWISGKQFAEYSGEFELNNDTIVYSTVVVYFNRFCREIGLGAWQIKCRLPGTGASYTNLIRRIRNREIRA